MSGPYWRLKSLQQAEMGIAQWFKTLVLAINHCYVPELRHNRPLLYIQYEGICEIRNLSYQHYCITKADLTSERIS